MFSCTGENDTTDAVLVARIMGDGSVWDTLPARFRAISDNRSRFDKPGITNIHITANVLSAFIGEVSRAAAVLFDCCLANEHSTNEAQLQGMVHF
jgi:hypothetical protein